MSEQKESVDRVLSRKEFATVMDLTDITKENLLNAKSYYISLLDGGVIDAKKLVAGIKTLKDVFIGDDKNPGVEQYARIKAVDECEKYGKGEKIFVGNYELRTQSVGGKWDFTGDPIWRKLNEEFEAAKEKMKA